jgi:hypothetical protein
VLVTPVGKAFDELGHYAASTEFRVRAMGVQFDSVYTEFGAKERPLTSVRDQARAVAAPLVLRPLESPTAESDEIEMLLRLFKEPTADIAESGFEGRNSCRWDAAWESGETTRRR